MEGTDARKKKAKRKQAYSNQDKGTAAACLFPPAVAWSQEEEETEREEGHHDQESRQRESLEHVSSSKSSRSRSRESSSSSKRGRRNDVEMAKKRNNETKETSVWVKIRHWLCFCLWQCCVA